MQPILWNHYCAVGVDTSVRLSILFWAKRLDYSIGETDDPKMTVRAASATALQWFGDDTSGARITVPCNRTYHGRGMISLMLLGAYTTHTVLIEG